MLATPPELDDHLTMRRAGADLLSLALMDTRNRSLQLHDAFQAAWQQRLAAGAGHRSGAEPPRPPGASALLRLADSVGCALPQLWLGRLGWFQEAWIARNVQRRRARACDPGAARLASIDPDADAWWDPRQADAQGRPERPLPDDAAVRSYLVDTLEVTLELLLQPPHSDADLYFFRLALFHEDAQAERLLDLAQALGLELPQQAWPEPQPNAGSRLPLPVGTQTLGWADEPPGFTREADRGRATQPLAGGNIDSRPVTWQQYLEFIQDGGYDERHWWTDAGWHWREARGTPLPRYVLAADGAVIVERAGRRLRAAAHQPVQYVSAHEAQAWCRWAGRRLPTEAEWEAAATRLAGRGWRWGEVWEWTADRLAPLPSPTVHAGEVGDARDAGRPAPADATAQPAPGHPADLGDAWGHHQVLRGAGTNTRRRLVHPRCRHHAAPDADRLATGFRSCGV